MSKYHQNKTPDGLPPLQEWVTEGQRNRLKARTSSAGLLRGGSVGAEIDGDYYGVCPRKAWLRYKGVDLNLPEEIELMTDQGEKNEEIWFEILQQGLPENLYVMDQEQFECTWETMGVPGSGSPDLVIYHRATDKPVIGLELKNISSLSKTKATNYELKPDDTHLIQAANYSIRMGDQYNDGVPLQYVLVYSSRSIWHMFGMGAKQKELIASKGNDVQFRYGKPMSVAPFHRYYYLDWEDGHLTYWTEGLDAPVKTRLDRDSIERYYTTVGVDIDIADALPVRPSTKTIEGKRSYSPCNYCDFAEVCDQYEDRSATEYLDHAKKFALDFNKQRTEKK